MTLRKVLGSATVLSTCALSVLLTGCGVGNLDTSSPQAPQLVPAFHGAVFGGQTPIVNATVKIYATGSDGSCTSSGSAAACIAGDTGYGVGTLLQEATIVNGGSAGQETDAAGNFSFAGGYFCPAGEFAYIVGSGGSPGNAGNAANSKILLVAALGRCEDLYTAVTGGFSGYKGSLIVVNEITTVAAGYALGRFATVSGSSVGIGAPSTNNAAKVSGYSTGTTTAAAGLYHAFLNAANLANPFSLTTLSSAPTVPPGNSKASLPTALINTIANVLANCVDTDGTGGQCSGLPGGSDTFTAVVTLAANPTFSGSSTAVTSFFNLPTGVGPFSPVLSAAPNDYSIAINYPAGTGNGNGINLKFPLSIALDVNDNLYIANNSKYAGGTTGNAASNIISLASNGSVNAQTATIGLIGADYSLSLDASTPTSNGYFGDAGYSTTFAIGRFTFSSTTGIPSDILTGTAGSASPHVYATAVDKSNNVWVWGTDGLFKSAAGGTAFNSANLASVTATAPTDTYIGLAIDPGQNIWMTGSSAIAVYPAGASSTGATITATAPGNPSTGISFTGAAGASTVYVSAYSTSPGLAYFAPTYNGSNAVTALNLATTGSQGLQTYGGKLAGSLFNAVDSAGDVWMADFTSQSLVELPGGTGSSAYVYKPCDSTAACNSLFATTNYGPVYVIVDSTGSLWVSTNTFNSLAITGGSLVQIIGSAAPSWPLLALGRYGVSP
jgi:hypothetical protein